MTVVFGVKSTYLAKVRDLGPSKTEDTVNGVAGERARQGGDGREVLAAHGDARDGYAVGVDGPGDLGAVAVRELEGAGLADARGGRGDVVLVLGGARGARAAARGHPEVGGAGW